MFEQCKEEIRKRSKKMGLVPMKRIKKILENECGDDLDWMIQMLDHCGRPVYWGNSGALGLNWTNDIEQAMRFTYAGASDVIAAMVWDPDVVLMFSDRFFGGLDDIVSEHT